MAPSSGQTFKIKLESGRVLGPIDLQRIRLLILKNQITGLELAREYPQGDWKSINQIPVLADLLVSRAKGTLLLEQPEVQPSLKNAHYLAGPTQVIGPTQVVTPVVPGEDDEKTIVVNQLDDASPAAGSPADSHAHSMSGLSIELDDNEKTAVFLSQQAPKPTLLESIRAENEESANVELPSRSAEFTPNISHEQTMIMELSQSGETNQASEIGGVPAKPVPGEKLKLQHVKKSIVSVLVTLAVVYIIYTLLFTMENKTPDLLKWAPIRPAMPSFDTSIKDPEKSAKYYGDGLKFYSQDTVPGYQKAAELFGQAARFDSSNVKALALLASSYLNLIDSSNKDENYFSVISKLIELSRAKNVELPETVIADVEFYITVNKAEAAMNRLSDYAKVRTNFESTMYYYLALTFYNRGDAESAISSIQQLPENKAFSAKVFYLRGLIAEKVGDTTAAIQEYKKALKLNPAHAKSRLAIARIYRATDIQSGAVHLDYLVKNPHLLGPKDLSLAYYLHSLLSQLYKSDEEALADMERAVRLDSDNHEYLLELYSLRAKAGDNLRKLQPTARMYFFLGEGEKFLKEGKPHEALTQFLQARQANDRSPLPLIKIGDMFMRLNNLDNAKKNYEMAAQRAPENIDVWSKYIDVLIQSYEWQEAAAAMDKFRKLPVPQSAIDKAAADMYAKQGQYDRARDFYRKAMARDTIDSSVYIAYAKTLMEMKNFKEAPFFFALALRFDPMNIDAVVGGARCIAATESVDRAISMLQDELQKGSVARAELLAAIAEMYMQKGSWPQAQQFVDQAMAANPEYAYPWKLQARVYLNNENTDKTTYDKALSAYSSYSDRNSSDPSGYLERYRIYVRKGEFERASEELGKIFAIYPKYPNLHFYKGALYSIMGNQQEATKEFSKELENNANSVPTLISLGKEYIKAGSAAPALTLFNKAMQLAPQSADAKAESAYANFLLKNYNGAIALYRAALQLDKANPLIYKRMGIAYREMGDQVNAAQSFRKYLEMEPDASDKAEFEMYR